MHNIETPNSAFQSAILLMAKRAAARCCPTKSTQKSALPKRLHLEPTCCMAALERPRGLLAERNAIYRQRRDAALHVLRSSAKLQVPCPEGAFYLLAQLKTRIDDQALALDLLEAGIATVPGSAFELPGHLRLSFATDEATLVEGCKRLVGALEAYA
ncbi:aminotransferase class I/II-fold pyridoxal phosphate-dependent enzyme [Pseudomonas sp. MAFF212428]|uniref:Aminotransferase class I/II-fold pyridoxal phosphate-dependent enzyme n=1 Tax=Pseudomonas brassicae TaxID=2708063 RepID=A0A6B3NPE2_9PSED|nr:aminotransferase class I/II-fold pyridoxal phosphate-dependent enzyme [Pseudomonas brassicae]NER62303.1 aminotransferase class I/II-fold pyridoxal phosphate-dependent enzyme [Pseudomonas brassicae]NER63726.1 aminotransferase class I/II-fold pyridoxal phosphate-dependent enzyme [Pseudomonas brassicae]